MQKAINSEHPGAQPIELIINGIPVRLSFRQEKNEHLVHDLRPLLLEAKCKTMAKAAYRS